MDEINFKAARDAFFSRFQPVIEHRLMYSADPTGSGTSAVAGDPTKMWVKDSGGNIMRINAGQMNPNMPAGVPLQVGATLGYNSPLPEAKAVFQQQYSSPTGATYNAVWVGSNHAIPYAASNGQLTSDANLLEFFAATSQGLMQGNTNTSWTLDTYNSGATNGSFVNAHVAEGTKASPSAVTSGKLLMYFGVYTFGATVFGANYDARLKFLATQTHTDTAHGTSAVLSYTPDGTLTETDALKVDTQGVTALVAVNKPIATVTGTTTAGVTHGTILVDATSGAVTINLPAVASSNKRVYTVKKIDSSGNAVTLDGNASETIDGATTYALSAQWQAVSIQCNGSAWYIIGKV